MNPLTHMKIDVKTEAHRVRRCLVKKAVLIIALLCGIATGSLANDFDLEEQLKCPCWDAHLETCLLSCRQKHNLFDAVSSDLASPDEKTPFFVWFTSHGSNPYACPWLYALRQPRNLDLFVLLLSQQAAGSAKASKLLEMLAGPGVLAHDVAKVQVRNAGYKGDLI